MFSFWQCGYIPIINVNLNKLKCDIVPIPMKKPFLQNREKIGVLVFLGSYEYIIYEVLGIALYILV